MRRGEIVALKWEDIDFQNKVIHVRHNAVMGRYKTTISDAMKTKASKRDVPLSADLEAWLLAQKRNAHSQYVLSMKNHKPLTKSSYKSMWKLIERELPNTHVTAHILRHPYVKPATKISFEAGDSLRPCIVTYSGRAALKFSGFHSIST
ncbi:MAG: tyrosine-type recombinase/integrase [Oscillospiraceae bacterium]|nr:tyrosine-type recombinase/integrase [Oscillospiraceae bacterium]